MTADRVRCLLRELPDGASEIYLHPAIRRDAELCRLMPDYEHEEELATLLDPDIAAFVTNLRSASTARDPLRVGSSG